MIFKCSTTGTFFRKKQGNFTISTFWECLLYYRVQKFWKHSRSVPWCFLHFWITYHHPMWLQDQQKQRGVTRILSIFQLFERNFDETAKIAHMCWNLQRAPWARARPPGSTLMTHNPILDRKVCVWGITPGSWFFIYSITQQALWGGQNTTVRLKNKDFHQNSSLIKPHFALCARCPR